MPMSDLPPRVDRRRFLKHSAVGVGLAAGWPSLLAATCAGPATRLQGGAADDARVIVFQGDSVTDAGRNRDRTEPNHSDGLGSGYAGIAAAQLLAQNSGSGWQCYNRGVSGHKVFELAARWQTDCLDLRPDVLSILIGVNDFWHTLSSGYDGTVEIYERDYRALLDRTRATLPDVALIIGEPFAVTGGTALSDAWYPAYAEYRAAARRVADAYDAAWIPYQSIFDEALERAPVEHWCPDGVHPAPTGNHLMAQAWLDSFRSAVSG